jgi:hypothetical protein
MYWSAPRTQKNQRFQSWKPAMSGVLKLEVDDCWHTGLLCLLSYDLAPHPRSKEVGTAAEGIGTPPSPTPRQRMRSFASRKSGQQSPHSSTRRALWRGPGSRPLLWVAAAAIGVVWLLPTIEDIVLNSCPADWQRQCRRRDHRRSHVAAASADRISDTADHQESCDDAVVRIRTHASLPVRVAPEEPTGLLYRTASTQVSIPRQSRGL